MLLHYVENVIQKDIENFDADDYTRVEKIGLQKYDK